MVVGASVIPARDVVRAGVPALVVVAHAVAPEVVPLPIIIGSNIVINLRLYFQAEFCTLIT